MAKSLELMSFEKMMEVEEDQILWTPSDVPKDPPELVPPPREVNLVHWFRRGLRLHDNPTLKAALEGATTFRCIYIMDPWFAGSTQTKGIHKWRFLIQSLQDLDLKLRELNSRLFVLRGQPSALFPRIFKEWNVSRLSFEVDPEPFARNRDLAVCRLAERSGVQVIAYTSHTLYDLQLFPEKNRCSLPLTFKRFQTNLQHMSLPEKPVAAICPADVQHATSPVDADHDSEYGIPTLKSLGFDEESVAENSVFVGGETEALLRLDRHLERKVWIANFEKPKMSTHSLMANATSVSAHLRFGCLSPRYFFWKLTSLYRSVMGKMDCPMSLHGQLLWREFFYLQATNNCNFDKMRGNPICVQIPWDHNPEAIARWAEGKTGFPWIDAIMTQLRQEGWVHQLARHAVVCFLTRGHLWMSWEEGMKVFDDLCLDTDWSLSAGNWMWLSCSTFFQKYFYNYCPVTFGQFIDPKGIYIRKYVPILSGFPNRYIHQPWTAPYDVQCSAQCLVGKDYPNPMVNHQEVYRLNLERMKQVYTGLTSHKGPLRRYVNKQLKHIIQQMSENPTERGPIEDYNKRIIIGNLTNH